MASTETAASTAAVVGGPDKSVNQVKSKASASLLYNNLSSNDNYLAYVHRNEVHLVKNNQTMLTSTEKGSSTSAKCVYAEKDPVSQVRFCRLSTFGPNVDILVVVTVGGGLHLYDESGQKLIQFHKLTKLATPPAGSAPVTPPAPGPSETHVATAKEAFLRGIAHDGTSTVIVGSASGHLLAFSASPKKLSLLRKIPAHTSPITELASHDGVLASGDENGNIYMWNTREAKDAAYTKTNEFKGNGEPVTSLSIGYGYLVAGYASGHIRLFSLETKTLSVEITAHSRAINAIDLHPTLPLLAAVAEDSFLSLWTLPTSKTPSVTSLGLTVTNTALLTGVRYVGRSASLIAVTAYDSRFIGILPTPSLP